MMTIVFAVGTAIALAGFIHTQRQLRAARRQLVEVNALLDQIHKP